LNDVFDAVDRVRPIGTVFSVLPPQIVTVDVTMTITAGTVEIAQLAVVAVENDVKAYLDGLSIGKPAFITRIAQRAYMADDRLENVADIKLNGLSSDIMPPLLGIIKAGLVTVSANGG
jgi:hypothetical protein